MKPKDWLIAALAALLVVTAWCPRMRAQGYDTLPVLVPIRAEIVINRALLASLDSIADTARVEHNRCGIGVIQSGIAYVDLLFAPKVIAATDSSMHTEGCPVATILEWHVHPMRANDFHPVAAWCYLSGGTPQSDLVNTHREGRVAAFHMVHVRRGVYCWWSLAQIAEHVRRHGFGQILRPIKGQTSW